ncbi:hypothetical protein BG005_009853 [Podila minutissima]|nr:hypothetical protein BG005_009853 [Podila minutissima]
MQGSTGTVASTSVLRLAYPRSKALSYVQTVSGPSRHFSGTRTTLNANRSSGNSGSGKLVADKINIDPKTKLRMEIRKEAMNSNGARGGNNTNNPGNKWTPAENWDPNQPGRYRQAYEENQNRSGYRPNNNPGSGNRRQTQDARRPGRYYDERSGQNMGQSRGGQPNQQRQNAPSSFATSSGFGFSAPTPAPKPAAPSSFATSSGFGFSSPAKAAKPAPVSPPKVNAQPNTPQKIKAETPKEVSSTPSTSSSSSTSGTTTGSTATTTGTTPAPAPKVSSPSSAPSTSTTQASSTSTQASSSTSTQASSSTSSPQTTPPTFTKSTRSAKENAKRHVEQRSKQRKQRQKPAKDVFIPEAINVSNLAGLLGARMPHFERTMKAMGMEITRHDHILTSEEASLLALEYNVNPVVGNTETLFDITSKPEPEDMSIYPLRPPVVTIMGHRITFLDTPGHAAFSAMRARGAHTTDIVVLVVAAEDGVMPQTAEAIKHAEEAGVPIIVAINKCDKYGAEPEKAKQALLKYGITVEDLGGETQCVEVSGLTGKNLDKLEEAILTLAEVLDLRAEVQMKGEGHIIESQIEKGRGSVATVLVKRGTLKVGDTIVAGDAWCKVKALVNDTGKNVKEAPPGTPAGDEMLGADSEEQAKLAITNRALKKERQEQLKTLVAINEKRRITAEEEDEEKMAIREHKRKAWLFHQGMLDTYPEPPQTKRLLSVAEMAAREEEQSEVKNLRMVVKGDVSGTVEAVCDALSGLPANQVKVSVIQSGVGNISESDIQFASSCNAMVLGFNVKADKKLMQAARQLGVGLKSYSVIYKLLDDVKIEMATLLPKDIEIQVVGEAKIAQVFPIKMKGGQTQNVAGCRIVNGGVMRKEDVRIVRNGEVIWDGKLSALKRIKEDIQEAKKGTECGMEFDGFQEFKEGDVIQSVKKVEVLRKL